MKYARVNDVELAYRDEGAGRPLALVHGFPLDHCMWDAQIAALATQWRVLAPDLRGFGRSGASDGPVAMRQFAADLAGLLDVLALNEPIVLGGLSMGGYIAFSFWEANPARVAGLILCDTRAAADAPAVAESREHTARRVLSEGPQFLADAMTPKLFAAATLSERPALVAAARDVMLKTDPRGIAAAALGMAVRPDMTARLPQIACPALVVVGAEDVISPPAEMRGIARAMPRARFVEIAGAGHMSPLEQPEAVNRAIEQFLQVLL